MVSRTTWPQFCFVFVIGTDMDEGDGVTGITDGFVGPGLKELEELGPPRQAEKPSSGRTENNNNFLFMAGLLGVRYTAGW